MSRNINISSDNFGTTVLALVLMLLLFHGEPSIAESVRVMFAQAAGLIP